MKPAAVTPATAPGGTFRVNGDGTFSFDPENTFDDLALKASRATSVGDVRTAARHEVSASGLGLLMAIVKNVGTADLPSSDIGYEAKFPQFRGYASIPNTDRKWMLRRCRMAGRRIRALRLPGATRLVLGTALAGSSWASCPHTQSDTTR